MKRAAIALTLLVVAGPSTGHAWSIRSGFAPANGLDDTKVGDAWTFYCPPGGSFEIWAYGAKDSAGDKSNLDPVLDVV